MTRQRGRSGELPTQVDLVDHAAERLRMLIEDGQEEIGLVAELVVERPDRDPRGNEDVLAKIGSGMPLAGERASTDLKQAPARTLTQLALLPRRNARHFRSHYL